ncbi:MAG: CDP-diacylglycerol--glycerol-3-phosphate 3-phosphatidyltransferase [Candidatus Taylorbacteria bacterium]|nr:CDP-diacylglycerol--glycerol-3-phosphate 3-phosphatidyltransferase [Candidatus Taylorbacteria bacterium]
MPKLKEKILNLAEARMKDLRRVTLIDRILKHLFLGLIPRSVTPNQITVFRFVSIPFIVFLLFKEYYLSAAILFILSSFSDALDGALARTTGQITRWGILADPLADKLLVGSVALILISRFLGWHFALLIVAIEMVTVVSAYYRYAGKVLPAKTVGKIKMILQCFGIIFLFFHVLFGGIIWLALSWIALVTAVVFALLSLLLYKSI